MPVVYFFTAIHDLYGEQVQTPAEGRRCFPIQTIYVTEGRGLVARCVSDLHASSIGVIYSEDDTGRDIMDGIHRQCGKLSLPCTARGVSIAPEALEQALPGGGGRGAVPQPGCHCAGLLPGGLCPGGTGTGKTEEHPPGHHQLCQYDHHGSL